MNRSKKQSHTVVQKQTSELITWKVNSNGVCLCTVVYLTNASQLFRYIKTV